MYFFFQKLFLQTKFRSAVEISLFVFLKPKYTIFLIYFKVKIVNVTLKLSKIKQRQRQKSKSLQTVLLIPQI